MAALQRGIGNGLQLDKLLPSSPEILQIPPELDMIVPINVPEGKSVPLFNENVEIPPYTRFRNVNKLSGTQLIASSSLILRPT
jgi:hypothetical protein